MDRTERAILDILEPTTNYLTLDAICAAFEKKNSSGPLRALRRQWIRLNLHRLCWQGEVSHKRKGLWAFAEYRPAPRCLTDAAEYRQRIHEIADCGGVVEKVQRDDDAAAIIAELFRRADDRAIAVYGDTLPEKIYGTLEVMGAATEFLEKHTAATLRILVRNASGSRFVEKLKSWFPENVDVRKLSDAAWKVHPSTLVLADAKSFLFRHTPQQRWPQVHFADVRHGPKLLHAFNLLFEQAPELKIA